MHSCVCLCLGKFHVYAECMSGFMYMHAVCICVKTVHVHERDKSSLGVSFVDALILLSVNIAVICSLP